MFEFIRIFFRTFLNLTCKDRLTYEKRLKNKIDQQKNQKTESDHDVDRHVGAGNTQ